MAAASGAHARAERTGSPGREVVVDEGAQRLRLGRGAAWALADELARLDVARPLVLCSSSSQQTARRLADPLPSARVTAVARQHVPREAVGAALREVAAHDVDGLIAVGGGSVIGLAKALARRRHLPILAVPSTLAGSEATPIWGETHGEGKETGRDLAVLPRVVLADPDVGRAVPAGVTAASGLNALAHATAAVTGPNANPVAEALAAAGAPRLLAALPAAVGGDLEARGEALLGAYLAARGLAIAGAGPHHRICHALGGALGLDHATTHSALLPHTVAALAGLDPTTAAALTRSLGRGDPAAALAALQAEIGAPRRLPLHPDDRDRAVRAAARVAAPLDEASVATVLDAARAAAP